MSDESNLPEIMSGQSKFGFDALAMWSLESLEKVIISETFKNGEKEEDDSFTSSIYGLLILSLYIYLEDRLNNGLRMVLDLQQKLRSKDDCLAAIKIGQFSAQQ